MDPSALGSDLGAATTAGVTPKPRLRRSLDEIREEALLCKRCSLCETRTTVVFGVGNPNAEVVFIGEAPGRQEDLGAEPFIGAAGKYLNKLLELAGIKREDIYIANVLKCRPPSNRDPRPDEIETCTPFLREQLMAISPDVLVTLGNFATRFVLKTDRGITSIRGRAYTAGRFYVLPTFHPAAAIYDKSKTELIESDFRLLRDLLKVERERKAARHAVLNLGDEGSGDENSGGASPRNEDSRGENSGDMSSGGVSPGDEDSRDVSSKDENPGDVS